MILHHIYSTYVIVSFYSLLNYYTMQLSLKVCKYCTFVFSIVK